MTESRTTVAPPRILTRVPKRMRERISRPNSSFPSGCLHEGPSRRSTSFWSAGSYGASHGANSAVTVSVTKVMKPAAASLFFRKNSVISDTRIHDRVHNVRGQVDQDVRQRNCQNAALHQWIISREDCLDSEPAQTGP